MRPSKLLLSTTLSLQLLIAASCAGPSAGFGQKLMEASRNFRHGLLFQDYQLLADLLADEIRGDFLQRAYSMERTLSVTEVEILSMTVDESGEKALTLSRLSYFELPSTVLHTEAATVHWAWVGGGWRIEKILGGPLLVP